jgi:putative ABC transport system substrate-binding protein
MADNFTKRNSPGAGEDWYGYVNATRVAQLTPVLHAKQLKLARDLVPAAALIGVLINPDSPKAELLLSDVQTAARTIGQSIHILNASSEGDLENAFAIIIAQHVGALVVTSDAFFNSQFDRIVELAARHHVPTIYNGASIPSGRGARLLRDFICLSVPQTQN